ncbi:MAG TPA: PDZ domain-containing protein [Blastocatellia bacterium]|nr:PDZ domain-containing protein [Blastocatellia bacterium]
MKKQYAYSTFWILIIAGTAHSQQPPSAVVPGSENRPWVVSVVHKIDLNKLTAQMRVQQKVRVGVPASAAADFLYNVATGLVIDANGRIVTRLANLDPEDKKQSISITTSEGVTIPARMIGVDCATGFAVLEAASLKISLPEFVPAALLEIGFPIKMVSADLQVATIDKNSELRFSPAFTVTTGEVAGKTVLSRVRGALALRSDGLVSKKDSSVVTTPANQLLGMAQYAGYGRAYLYTIDFIRNTVARRVIEKKASVPAGWLGVVGENVAQIPDSDSAALGLKEKMGVIVREITPASPAAAAGLLPNDVIVGFDDLPITGAQDLTSLLSSLPAEHRAVLRVIRSGKPSAITAVLGARPFSGPELWIDPWQSDSTLSEREQVRKQLDEIIVRYRQLTGRSPEVEEARREITLEIRQLQDTLRYLEQQINEQMARQQKGLPPQPPVAANNNAGERASLAVYFRPGFTGLDLTPQLARYFRVANGVLLKEIIKGSLAERSGLRAGDIIVGTLREEPVNTWLLESVFATSQGVVQLKVVRERRRILIKLNPQE